MTERVGLVGWPVAHSISPSMHNAAFQAVGLDWVYDAMAIPPDIVRHAFVEPKRHGYIGLNVTVPYKQAALEYVRPDEKAQAIGAVNTIDFRNDTGTNTDVDGFIDDLKAHDIFVENQRVVVIGAGGAARAAVYGLWQQGADVAVINRTRTRAEEMLTQLTFSAGVSGVSVIEMLDILDWSPGLIVNCTSVGMWPYVEASVWPENISVPPSIVAYDMIYRPATTRFMQMVRAAGGYAIGGLGMLVRQGASAFSLWTGVEAPVEVMYSAAQSALTTHDV